MEYIIAIIDSVAWPVAVVWLGYLFRQEIRGLFDRVSHLKYKDLEAKFEKQLVEAEEEAKSLPAEVRPPEHEEPVYPVPYNDKYEQLLRISEESPRAALLEAWIEVESALFEAAERADIKAMMRHPNHVLNRLIKDGHVAKTVYPLFDSLRKMRNEAAHLNNFVPKLDLVKRYLELSIELSHTFHNLLTE
ncbi:MAG: hypothetical protein IH886_03295 [Nitrospinae bacterium]|nr:hypothetical protein [Nitrospinota bacterium]